MPSPQTDTVLGEWQTFENKFFKPGQKIPPAQYRIFKACFYAGTLSTLAMNGKYKALTPEEQNEQHTALAIESAKYMVEIIGAIGDGGFLVP